MRILVLHSRYLSGEASGENRVVDDEVRLLREAGHAVEVWEPAPEALSGFRLARAGIETIWSARAAARIRELVASHRPDVFHLHNLFPMLSPAVVRAATGTTPIVMTLHNYRLMCLPGLLLREGRICHDCVGRIPWPGVVHRCYRGSTFGSSAIAASLTLHRAIRTFDRIDLYLAISSFVRDKHVEAGFRPSDIQVKPHFAWAARRREGPGDYFLYLGRLSSEKGVETLVAAWRTVPCKLVVAGDGPEAERLRASAGPNVDFTGMVSPADVPSLMREARAVMVPSTCYEGAGKVVLEAYAAGVPAVASRIGGLPEAVLEGKSGYLVPPGDVSAWSDAALRLLDDGESERLGDGARALWEERYSPEHALANLEAAYRSARAGA